MPFASPSRRLTFLSGLLLFFVLSPNLPAQQETGELPTTGIKALNDLYYKHRTTIRQLLSAQVDPTKETEAVLVLAQNHVYRYTWPEAREAGKVLQFFKEFDGDLGLARNKLPGTQKLLDDLTKHIVACSDDMFRNREPLARVNYARVLARLAQDGGEEVLDPLIKALKDEKQNDGVKYWALVGLRDFFQRGHQAQPVYLKDKKRETEAVVTLIALIERESVILPSQSADEVEGIRLLRREAVRALGLTRYPAVLDDKKVVAGRTAQVLMRVIATEGFVPEVKVEEQHEAAVGLCRLQWALYPDYQPDAAARFIGLAVVELANGYGADTGKDKEHGWKVRGARLSEALAVFDADTKNNAKKGLNAASAKYVADMLKDAYVLVRGVETKASANPANFNNWLRTNPPANEQAYKSLPDSLVKFPETSGN